MDELHGIPGEIASYILGVEGPTEFKVDLRVLYLRRVHHFCFYAGKWCKDEWTLRDSCGAAVVREPFQQAEGQGDAWVSAHEKRIQDFLATICLDRPDASLDEAKILNRFQELCNEKTVTLSEKKFQCQECGKLFKGPDYVCKHVLRVHPKTMEEAREESHLSAARSAFLSDASRPPAGALLRK